MLEPHWGPESRVIAWHGDAKFVPAELCKTLRPSCKPGMKSPKIANFSTHFVIVLRRYFMLSINVASRYRTACICTSNAQL